MKIFTLAPKENWICDRFVHEWNSHYSEYCVSHPKDADIIWLLADWCWNQIPVEYLKNKKVVASVHHIVPEKFAGKEELDFKARDQFVDLYHVPCEKTRDQIASHTNKPVWVLPFWVNGSLWHRKKESVGELRSALGIDEKCFLIGSFQRDTEGHDLKSPKLEKGPDLFCDAVEKIFKEKKKEGIEARVLLAGWRRQYVMGRLQAAGIKFYYAELPQQEAINTFYNILDLYIVAARYEGGPQAIVECACTETPIISTDVGVASLILPEHSIFKPGTSLSAQPDVEYAKNAVQKYLMPVGFEPYMTKFKEIIS